MKYNNNKCKIIVKIIREHLYKNGVLYNIYSIKEKQNTTIAHKNNYKFIKTNFQLIQLQKNTFDFLNLSAMTT